MLSGELFHILLQSYVLNKARCIIVYDKIALFLENTAQSNGKILNKQSRLTIAEKPYV